MEDINKSFDTWAKDHMSFPEDFLADAMNESEESKVLNHTDEFSVSDVAKAAAAAATKCEMYSLEEVNVNQLLKFSTILIRELFGDEIFED